MAFWPARRTPFTRVGAIERLRGGIIDTAAQVSATTRFDLSDVGLQQVSRAAPQGAECTGTDGTWKIGEPDLLTTS